MIRHGLKDRQTRQITRAPEQGGPQGFIESRKLDLFDNSLYIAN